MQLNRRRFDTEPDSDHEESHVNNTSLNRSNTKPSIAPNNTTTNTNTNNNTTTSDTNISASINPNINDGFGSRVMHMLRQVTNPNDHPNPNPNPNPNQSEADSKSKTSRNPIKLLAKLFSQPSGVNLSPEEDPELTFRRASVTEDPGPVKEVEHQKARIRKYKTRSMKRQDAQARRSRKSLAEEQHDKERGSGDNVGVIPDFDPLHPLYFDDVTCRISERTGYSNDHLTTYSANTGTTAITKHDGDGSEAKSMAESDENELSVVQLPIRLTVYSRGDQLPSTLFVMNDNDEDAKSMALTKNEKLFRAAYENRVTEVEILVGRQQMKEEKLFGEGADDNLDLNAQEPALGETALHIAAERGFHQIVIVSSCELPG